MDPNQEPSPAPSLGESFQGQLLSNGNHNARSSYSREMPQQQRHRNQQQMPTPAVQTLSLPNSRYGSPSLLDMPTLPREPQYMQGNHGSPSYGYPTAQSPYGGESSAYPQLGDPYQLAPYHTPETSPPTPTQQPTELRTLRSRTTQRQAPTSKTSAASGVKSGRVTKPDPRPKQKQKAKARQKAKNPKVAEDTISLTIPLSELAKTSKRELFDLDKYANRSAEERHREMALSKDPEKIKRPMNAFLLYRKVYQHTVKDWCKQNNHQVVSTVCGHSWKHLESKEFKDRFTALANLESKNHLAAFPDYKFQPGKPKEKKADKEAIPVLQNNFDSHEEYDDGSDLEDYDWRGTPAGHQSVMSGTPAGYSDIDPDWRPRRSTYGPRSYTPHTQQSQYSPVAYPPLGAIPAYGSPSPAPPLHGLNDTGDFANGYYYQPPFHPSHVPMQGANAQDFMLRHGSPPAMYGQHLLMPQHQYQGMPQEHPVLDFNASSPPQVPMPYSLPPAQAPRHEQIDPLLQDVTSRQSLLAETKAEAPAYAGDFQVAEQSSHDDGSFGVLYNDDLPPLDDRIWREVTGIDDPSEAQQAFDALGQNIQADSRPTTDVLHKEDWTVLDSLEGPLEGDDFNQSLMNPNSG